MIALRNRKTLATTAALACFAGGIALAGPAAAAVPADSKIFSYAYNNGDTNSAGKRSLGELCDFFLLDANDDPTVAGVIPDNFRTSLKQRMGVTLVTGTTGDDVISTGSGSQFVLAFGGNDTISTGSGDDYVCGGAGNDTINLGSGNDRAYGDTGNDTISGGSDDDYLDGGAGSDTLSGGSGDDRLLNAGAGCSGGSGTDSLAC